MKQSLPGIERIATVPCQLLSPNIIEKYKAGVPIGVFAITTPIEHYGNASCEAVSEFDEGGYVEKASLHFNTTTEISQQQNLAFVITDVNGKSFVIGCMEAPYPIVNITQKVDEDTNIYEVKVSFTRIKALIPCST